MTYQGGGGGVGLEIHNTANGIHQSVFSSPRAHPSRIPGNLKSRVFSPGRVPAVEKVHPKDISFIFIYFLLLYFRVGDRLVATLVSSVLDLCEKCGLET